MKLPSRYLEMREQHPDVMEAYEALGTACVAAGPLDARTIALVKLGAAIGAGLEGGAHSQVRKALEAGCTREEILHATLVLTPTLGFAAMMRARSWVRDVLEREPKT